MQIHSQNFSHLAQFGITPHQLYTDSCLNIYTGAYYLAIAFKRWGYSWRAVGAYNAGFRETDAQEKKRQKYAQEIQAIYMDIKKKYTTKMKNFYQSGDIILQSILASDKMFENSGIFRLHIGQIHGHPFHYN